MKELNHRVKNNLMMVSSLLRIKDAALGSCADLSYLEHQIDAILIIHERLSNSPILSRIDMHDYIGDLLDQIFSICAYQVYFHNGIDHLRLPTNTALPVGLIINELATNAVKCGFTPEISTRFRVEMKKDPGGSQYLLVVSNSGKAFPEQIDIHDPTSLGLQFVSALVSQINGRMELQRSPHPVFTIRFPV